MPRSVAIKSRLAASAGASAAHAASAHFESQSGLDLNSFLPYQLTFSVGAVSRVLTTEIRRRFGLNAAEWRVLNIVGSFAPLSTRTVARYSSMEKAKISRATTRLTARGLVTHSVDPSDRRLVRLALSDRGKRLHARMSRVAREFEAALMRSLSREEAALLPTALVKLRVAAESFELGRAARPFAQKRDEI
jgi:DNA-binding MarR family transcriptional regulator